jgi:hypothetical protein
MLGLSNSQLRATLLVGMIALTATPQDAFAAEPTRLALAREAAAALNHAGGAQDALRPRIAQVLFSEGACTEARAVFDLGSDPRLFFGQGPAARRCLDPLARSWASLRPTSREEAQRLHAAGAYLRLAGQLRDGEEAMRRALFALASDATELDGLSRQLKQLMGRLGGSLPSDLWLARVDEIVLYEGTPLAAARLADYLPAARRISDGLAEADQLARLAYKADRRDLARAYLDCLPQTLTSGSREEVRARMFAEHGEVDRAAALLPSVAFSAWYSILRADKGALAARMIDSKAIVGMTATDRLNAYAELGSALLFKGDRAHADLAIDRALAISPMGSTPPLATRKRLSYLLAELGRADVALDLIARASPEERADIGREVMHGALSGGQIALFDLARTRCGCDPDASRFRSGLGAADWLSPTASSRRFERLLALIASMPIVDRAGALEVSISGLTTPSEWRAARTFIDAERNPAVRSRLLVRLGHAMFNAERIREAGAVAEAARAVAPARSAEAYDVAWLLHRVGRTNEALAIARMLEPEKKAELLTNIAS